MNLCENILYFVPLSAGGTGKTYFTTVILDLKSTHRVQDWLYVTWNVSVLCKFVCKCIVFCYLLSAGRTGQLGSVLEH